jgi:hypothetical protein
MKKCSKCGIEKSLTEFHKNKGSKDGHRSECKSCTKQQKAEWYVQNKERIKQQHAEWYAQNKEKIKKQKAEYYARPDVKERKKQYNAERYARPEVKEKKAEYYAQKAAEQPACIYEIKNLLNNKIYIGETIVGELRWKEHLRKLRGNYHINHNLQQDFNEHGEEVLEWSIIKELPKDKDILLLEEARELERRIDRGEDLYNLILTIEQIKMLKENA